MQGKSLASTTTKSGDFAELNAVNLRRTEFSSPPSLNECLQAGIRFNRRFRAGSFRPQEAYVLWGVVFCFRLFILFLISNNNFVLLIYFIFGDIHRAAEVFYYSVIINVGFKISGFSDEYFKYSGALVAFLLMSI